MPADKKIWNRMSLTNVVPQNTAIVSAITLYHLVRLLITPITLADSIKTTAMVDSGTMGNFIHPLPLAPQGQPAGANGTKP
jgi:hypothetical protein